MTKTSLGFGQSRKNSINPSLLPKINEENPEATDFKLRGKSFDNGGKMDFNKIRKNIPNVPDDVT